jgi:hypothetical protein
VYLFCNSRFHIITLYSGNVCVYYASMVRCWHLVWILVRTDHPCLGVRCHTLNLAGHLTSLSGPTRARNPLLPIGIASLARNCGGGLDALFRICLRSSMMLRRSSRLRSYSCVLRFYVMCRCTSCSNRCRFGLAEDAASLRARLVQLLRPTDGSPLVPLEVR